MKRIYGFWRQISIKAKFLIFLIGMLLTVGLFNLYLNNSNYIVFDQFNPTMNNYYLIDNLLFETDSNYVGKGAATVVFEIEDPDSPAKFYTFSAPAHMTYPTKHIDIESAKQGPMGDDSASNKRIIFLFLHPAILDII